MMPFPSQAEPSPKTARRSEASGVVDAQHLPVASEPCTLRDATGKRGRSPVAQWFLSPAFFGFLCSVLAELLYSGSYFFLRALTNEQVSSDWTLMIKESVTVAFSLPLILWLIVRGKFILPSRNVILTILFGALCVQLLGARFHLWSFAVIGMVLTMPFVQTFQILATSVLGTAVLRERMNLLKIVTMLVLILAVFLLAASQLVPNDRAGVEAGALSNLQNAVSGSRIGLGILMTLLTGLGYAAFILILRVVLKENRTRDEQGRERVSTPLVMFLVCAVGVVVGGSGLFLARGLDGFRNISHTCLGYALASGVLNYFAFYLRNIGIRYISASVVSFVSIIQILTLTVVGIFVYHETANALVWAGLSLSMLGVILTGYGVQEENK
ncbi:MAG: DMT family transporter [Planctomycetia bacterium]|nr:DMT family transporter [Planctomycetia bacterium]